MWHQFAQNPQAISSIYKSIPSLQRARLSVLNLLEDGPALRLHLHPTEFPEVAPARWARQQFNRVMIELHFYGLNGLKISGWSTQNEVNLSIVPLDANRKQLRLQSSSCQLETEFEFFTIARVEGYQAGE